MEECMLEIGTLHKKGWLTKSPPVTQFNANKSWKRRYFVLLQVNPDNKYAFRKSLKKEALALSNLQDFYLVYWESDAEQRKSGSKPIRAIQLLEHYHIHKYAVYENKYHNVIVLNTDNRVYFFSAENEIEMNSWSNHLNNAVHWCKTPTFGDISHKECKDANAPVLYEVYDHLDHLTSPKPWEITKKSNTYSSGYNRNNESGVCSSPSSPNNKSMSLRHASFGSVYGYNSQERCNSVSINQQVKNDVKCSDVYEQMDGNLKDKINRPLPISPPQHYIESSVNINHQYVNDNNRLQKKHRTNSPSEYIKRPSNQVSMTAMQESVMKEPAVNERCKKEIYHHDIGKTKNLSSSEIYKFSKGPDFAVLSLFDTKIQLPCDTVANITSDGLVITYGSHEIIIRKITKTDVIQV